MGPPSQFLPSLLPLLLLLLLGAGTVTSQPLTVLDDITIVEGRLAGEEIVTIRDLVNPSRTILPEIMGNQHPRVFEMYFNYTDDEKTILTRQEISRDSMAIELQQRHLPVSFTIIFYEVEGIFTVHRIRVTIHVRDLDNNSPVFVNYETRPFLLPISEGSIGSSEIGNTGIPRATDNDEGNNTVQHYALVDNVGGLFSLGVRRDGNGFINDIRLVLNSVLDREQRAQYSLQIVATEGNENPDSATLMVNITVTDICDEPPRFPVTRYFPDIEENSPEGTTIFPNITAIDLDVQDVINYEISEVCSHVFETTPHCVVVPDTQSPFDLDRESGALTINRELDREEFAQYEITILAVDDCGSTGTATVVVTVLNVNDNAPSVSTAGVENSMVPEHISVGYNVYFLNVRDPDYGESGTGGDPPQFTFHLLDNSTGTPMETNLFQLDRNPLQIRTMQSLDRETTSFYALVLNVTDWGSPNMSTIFQLPIHVVDINDNSPIFDSIQSNYNIRENTVLNTVIETLHATDRDSFDTGNGRVSYILPASNETFPHQELFAVDSMGRLTVNGTLDREQQEFITVLVQARDNPDASSGAPRSDFLLVNITLIDLNDNAPRILAPPEVVQISESEPVGTTVFTVEATDEDTPRYSTLTYTLASASGHPFLINTTTGRVVLTAPLDYDTTTSYSLTVEVSDGDTPVTRGVTVAVRDVNDERCVFDRSIPYMAAISENGPEGFHVVDISATDRDTPQAQLRYEINEGNEAGSFRINPTTGDILTTRSLNRDFISNYTLTVSCNDGSGIPVYTTVLVRIIDQNDNVPQFEGLPYDDFTVSENLPNGTVVDTIRATDTDSTGNGNGAVRYRLLGVTPAAVSSWFHLNEQTGEITTTQVLDREAPEFVGDEDGRVELNVEAFDTPSDGSDYLFNTTDVYIEITDRNDRVPVFAAAEVTFTLPENYAIGRFFPEPIQATDADIPPNNQIEYRISGRSPSGTTRIFSINPDTGYLRLLSTLDYEQQTRHEFEVQAVDATMRNHQSTQMVIVNVQNVAENNITITGFTSDVSLRENVGLNHTVTQFMVTDINQAPLLVNLPRLTYSIVGLDGAEPTELALRSDPPQSRLIVYVRGNVDRENPVVGNSETVTRQFNITVSDPDTTEQSHGSISAILSVTIQDENDNPPVFGQSLYHFQVEENNDVSVSIGQVSATDIDFEANGTPGISYQILDQVPFEVDPLGHIRTTESLDRDAVASYQFSVIARDGGTPPMSTTARVSVNVSDLNDNDPEFDPTQNRTFVVGEETSVGTVVATLRFLDRDDGAFGRVNISIGDVMSPHFVLEPNGSIVLAEALDREERLMHFFTVVARDGGGRWSTADVNILVRDYNDNPPIFNPVNTILIHEDKPVGMVFATVTAEDADQGRNSEVRYAIGNYSLSQTFCINPETGGISLCVQFPGCEEVADFERQSEYDVSIVAYDQGFPRHIVTKNVRIIIRPVNEHPPLFDRNLLIVYVNETQRTGMEVARIRAWDMDRDDHITYEVFDEGNQTSQLFHYDQAEGVVVNNGILDYNSRALYRLYLQAQDSNNSISHMQLVVIVNNINDHAPQFDPESLPGAAHRPIPIPETTPTGTVVWTLKATDQDNATHDAVSYHLRGGGGSGHFAIDPLTGEISVASPLDYETRDSYTLEVYAEDTGEPRRQTPPTMLSILVLNENDESPIFTSDSYSFSVRENQPPSTVAGRVSAPDRDNDTYGVVRYSVSFPGIGGRGSEYFDIDPDTGDVFTLVALDREALAREGQTSGPVTFALRVQASDGGRGLTAMSASADVTVRVMDANDNGPSFDEPRYLVRISATQAQGVLTTLTITDPDENGNDEHRFEIVSDSPGGVALEVTPAGNVRLTEDIPSAHLPMYPYTLRVTDARDSSLSSTARLELIIEDINDHHPVFNPAVSEITVNELTPSRTVVFEVEDVVIDLDEGNNGRLSYAFPSPQSYPQFEIDQSTGEVSLRERLDYEGTQTYDLTLLALDMTPGTRRTATGTLRVTVDHGNEFAPEFVGVPVQLTLSHLPHLNLKLFTVMANDRDDGTDGDVRFNIYDPTEVFSIERDSGIIRNQGLLEHDMSFNVIIGAYDLGNPFRSSNTTIRINVENGPEGSRPNFVENPRTITLPETDVVGGFLNTDLVTNPMAQTFHIARQTVVGGQMELEMFSISDDGRLSNLAPLDYEGDREYSLVIESRIETTSSRNNEIRRMSDYLMVTLTVTNVNDNRPLFSTVDDQTFREDTPVGTSLFRVLAIDGDDGLEGEMNYVIIRGDNEDTFRINASSGQVYLDRPLDREVVAAYDLVIRAHDLSNQPLSSEITVRVNVGDVNDFATTYGGRNFSLGVYESPHTRNGDRIVRLAATDLDEGPPLRYSLELVEASNPLGTQLDLSSLPSTFEIHPDTGMISLATQTLDRESVNHYLLHVMATDHRHTADTYLTIQVLDVNDSPPTVDFPARIIDVKEGMPVGYMVSSEIDVADADVGINSWVKYSLGSGWPAGFGIDPLSGIIRTTAVIRSNEIVERFGSLSFIGDVVVQDQGVRPHTTTVPAHISVIDVNNHPPEFESNSIILSRSIAADVGTVIHTFEVTDLDYGSNAFPVMFSIPRYYAEANSNFAIDAGNGMLSLREPQTRAKSYNFVIHASNSGFNPRCVEFVQASSINVTVNIRPINTGCPQFSEPVYQRSVPEETSISVSLLTVNSTDPDSGDSVTYSFANSSSSSLHPFRIHPLTGALTLVGTLDRERVESYVLTVVAMDDGFPSLSCSARVEITVLDVNDHPPVFVSSAYSGSVRENLPSNSPVLRVEAGDVDLEEASRVEYALSREDVPFRIDSSTGEIFTTQTLDYETLRSGRYNFGVRASDHGTPRLSSLADVTIRVQDVNEFEPQIMDPPSDPIQIRADTAEGTPVGTVRATDDDLSAMLVYSFGKPAPTCYFELNNVTGEIRFRVASAPCQDGVPTQKSEDPEFFILQPIVRVSDGNFSDEVQLTFMLDTSLCVTCEQTPVLPVEIIAASITGVLAIVFMLVCVIIVACICRARKSSKIRINDTTDRSALELQKRFGSGRSTKSGSGNGGIVATSITAAGTGGTSGATTPTGSIYKQTLPHHHHHHPHHHHEHNTMNLTHSAGGSGASSARQSYMEGVGDQNDRAAYPSPGVIKSSLVGKPYRSTSDLGSSMAATDLLSGESQETAPYPKSQIEKIYAKNADLLNQSDSNESIHMFGSEGGGESDGGDDMLFAKFNDLDDDDDSTTMQDEEEEEEEEVREYQPNSSRDDLNVPVLEDPYAVFDHPAALWAPRANNMADTIEQMAIGSYDPPEDLHAGSRRGPHYVMGAGEFSKSQEGVSMYGGGSSTQESTRPLLRHAPPPQSRLPPHLMQGGPPPPPGVVIPPPPGGPDFYPYDDTTRMHDHHHHHHHGGPPTRGPKYPGVPPSSYSHDPRHGGMVVPRGGASQEVPVPYGYHGDYMHPHHPMHHEMGGMMGGDHSPSSSTPTEGTLNTRATTNEYESDLMYSSDTSLNTNTEDPPHLRGYSQSTHSQRHGYH